MIHKSHQFERYNSGDNTEHTIKNTIKNTEHTLKNTIKNTEHTIKNTEHIIENTVGKHIIENSHKLKSKTHITKIKNSQTHRT